MPMTPEQEFYLNRLAVLKNARVVGFVFGDDGNYGLRFKCPEKKREKALFFLRDDEGNGPGSFSISEL